MDGLHLDRKYFIDESTFNCPFCGRRNVIYRLEDRGVEFDWTKNKKSFAYFVSCTSCNNKSMHLSFEQISVGVYRNGRYVFELSESQDLDRLFFYSVPTSFFVLDSRIPAELRELFSEAEGCLKSNFLTGATACARKIVYELAGRHDVQAPNYEERIKALKNVFPSVDSTYFDTLVTIQEMTSNKVHENAYDGWKSEHLRLILATLAEILIEIYQLPELRKERRQSLIDLRNEVLGDKQNKDV